MSMQLKPRTTGVRRTPFWGISFYRGGTASAQEELCMMWCIVTGPDQRYCSFTSLFHFNYEITFCFTSVYSLISVSHIRQIYREHKNNTFDSHPVSINICCSASLCLFWQLIWLNDQRLKCKISPTHPSINTSIYIFYNTFSVHSHVEPVPAVIEQGNTHQVNISHILFIFYSQVHNIASVSFFRVTKTFFTTSLNFILVLVNCNNFVLYLSVDWIFDKWCYK